MHCKPFRIEPVEWPSSLTSDARSRYRQGELLSFPCVSAPSHVGLQDYVYLVPHGSPYPFPPWPTLLAACPRFTLPLVQISPCLPFPSPSSYPRCHIMSPIITMSNHLSSSPNGRNASFIRMVAKNHRHSAALIVLAWSY